MTFTNTVQTNIQTVIASCAAQGMPVYWTAYKRSPRAPGSLCTYYAGLGSDEVYGIDVSNSQIVESLHPQNYGFSSRNVFKTAHLSSFSNEALAKRLLQHDVIVLVGGWTDHCITATAHDAFSRDISVCVVQDACFTLKNSHGGFHDAAIQTLGHSIAKICTTKDIMTLQMDIKN